MMSRAPVNGVCPVLATPFDADGAVDRDGFARLIDHVVAAGARSAMFPGFASEYYKLTYAERSELTNLLVERTRGVDGFTTVISIPDHATHVAVRRAKEAAEAGASALNLLPPHQLAPSAQAVHEHLLLVAAAVAPTPVIVQYAPAQTGTALDAASLSALAREATNFVQVKVESTPPGGLISALALQDPALSSIVGYGGVQLIDALRRGAVGVQPGSAFVEIYLRIWSAWQAGRREEATALHTRLLPFISYWMQDVELFVSADKRISHLRGILDSAHCRAPARTLDSEELATIDRFLAEFATELQPV